MNKQPKTVGAFSRLLIILLLFFGLFSLISIGKFNAAYSGWTYATSLADSQSQITTIMTMVGDTYYFFFGKLALLVALVFTAFHFLFSFQRTSYGFSWLNWLVFTSGMIFFFFGIAALYDYTLDPTGKEKVLLYGMYKRGGFATLIINYLFLKNLAYKILTSFILVIIGFFTMYITIVKGIVKEYIKYLQGKDLSTIHLAEYKYNTQNLAILSESIKSQSKYNTEDSGFKIYYIPSLNTAQHLANLTLRVKGLERILLSYQRDADKTLNEFKTQAILERMLEQRKEDYQDFYDQIAEQSLWFTSKAFFNKWFRPSRVKLGEGPLSHNLTKHFIQDGGPLKGLDLETLEAKQESIRSQQADEESKLALDGSEQEDILSSKAKRRDVRSQEEFEQKTALLSNKRSWFRRKKSSTTPLTTRNLYLSQIENKYPHYLNLPAEVECVSLNQQQNKKKSLLNFFTKS